MRRRLVLRGLLVAVPAVAAATLFIAQGDAGKTADTDDPVSFYRRLRGASVKILTSGRMNGSGCFIDARGTVLTAAHVIRGKADDIEILSSNGHRYAANRVAADPGHDIALLAVAGEHEPFPFLRVADTMPPPAAEVMLISSPLWRHDLLLKGSVARLEPSYSWNNINRCYTRCNYVAGASPVGSSGGCWVNHRGRVVGVQSGYLNSKDKSPVGVAFCSPTEPIHALIAARSDIPTATLGGNVDELWTQSPGFIARLPKGTEGIVTPVIHTGGAMEQAGFTTETVILAAAGRPVSFQRELLDIVRTKKPGDTIALKVIRADEKKPRTVTVTLGNAG